MAFNWEINFGLLGKFRSVPSFAFCLFFPRGNRRAPPLGLFSIKKFRIIDSLAYSVPNPYTTFPIDQNFSPRGPEMQKLPIHRIVSRLE
jgi:hypothetical protein